MIESLAYSQIALAYELDEDVPVLQLGKSSSVMMWSGLIALSVMALASEAIAVLKLGDRGAEVKAVQTRLQELGYFKATATGYFGPITKGAVIRFQKAQNLQVDGRVGTQTQAALQTTTAANTASTGTWRRGSQGEAVRTIQEQLGIAGFYNYAANGVFDTNTENAVKAFQQAQGLAVDGVVGPNTQAILPALGGKVPETNAIAQTPEPEVIYLEQGSRGARVRSLQQRLRTLGYYQGEVNGVFDADTTEAVMRFQQAQNLTVDGVVGPRTFTQLGEAQPVATTSPPATPTAEPTAIYLGRGSQGTRVRSLQQRLRTLNYYQGEVNGRFDAATEEALRRFQRAQSLTVDGVAGPRTFTQLGQAQPANTAPPVATPAPTPTPTTTAANPTPTPEIPSEQVRSLQQRLSERGFYDGDVDGVWGPKTQEAVENAQRVYNVEAEDLLKGEF